MLEAILAGNATSNIKLELLKRNKGDGNKANYETLMKHVQAAGVRVVKGWFIHMYIGIGGYAVEGKADWGVCDFFSKLRQGGRIGCGGCWKRV